MGYPKILLLALSVAMAIITGCLVVRVCQINYEIDTQAEATDFNNKIFINVITEQSKEIDAMKQECKQLQEEVDAQREQIDLLARFPSFKGQSL